MGRVGEGPSLAPRRHRGQADLIAPAAQRLEQALGGRPGGGAGKAHIMGGSAPHPGVCRQGRRDRVNENKTGDLVGIARGEQVDVQPRHRMAGDHEGPRLAKRGQQFLQVRDDGQPIARAGSGVRQRQAGAVIGDRGDPPGRQLVLDHRPVRRESERSSLEQNGQLASLGARADHVHLSAVDLDALTEGFRGAADFGHTGFR